jgi:hypothetical protein
MILFWSSAGKHDFCDILLDGIQPQNKQRQSNHFVENDAAIVS